MKYLFCKKNVSAKQLNLENNSNTISLDFHTFVLNMPKYRLLSNAELLELEKEFIEYLILNGIAADDWENSIANKLPIVDEIIELFSDVVFESILRKITFLEYREKASLKIFQCLPDKLAVVVMEANEAENVDFTDPEYIQRASTNPPESLKVFTTDKHYSRVREAELFEMLQTGCVITDDKLFKTLCLSITK